MGRGRKKSAGCRLFRSIGDRDCSFFWAASKPPRGAPLELFIPPSLSRQPDVPRQGIGRRGGAPQRGGGGAVRGGGPTPTGLPAFLSLSTHTRTPANIPLTVEGPIRFSPKVARRHTHTHHTRAHILNVRIFFWCCCTSHEGRIGKPPPLKKIRTARLTRNPGPLGVKQKQGPRLPSDTLPWTCTSDGRQTHASQHVRPVFCRRPKILRQPGRIDDGRWRGVNRPLLFALDVDGRESPTLNAATLARRRGRPSTKRRKGGGWI